MALNTDDAQWAALALLAQELGLSSVFVADDGSPDYGADSVHYFVRAAERLGLAVAGSASWDPEATSYDELVAQIERSGAGGVFLGGLPVGNTGELIRALRSRLGEGFAILGADTFFPAAALEVAGEAAVGMYLSFPGAPDAQLPQAGRRFVEDFAATQPGGQVPSYTAAYAAQAAEVLLNAIARSDGTRASVVEELFATEVEDGILGSFGFDANGDTTLKPFTIFRIVGGDAPSETLSAGFEGSVVDRVITVPPELVAGG